MSDHLLDSKVLNLARCPACKTVGGVQLKKPEDGKGAYTLLCINPHCLLVVDSGQWVTSLLHMLTLLGPPTYARLGVKRALLTVLDLAEKDRDVTSLSARKLREPQATRASHFPDKPPPPEALLHSKKETIRGLVVTLMEKNIALQKSFDTLAVEFKGHRTEYKKRQRELKEIRKRLLKADSKRNEHENNGGELRWKPLTRSEN